MESENTLQLRTFPTLGDDGNICDSEPPGAGPGQSKAEYYIQQFNAKNAKKVALLLVVGFCAYHGILNWRFGKKTESMDLIIDTFLKPFTR